LHAAVGGQLPAGTTYDALAPQLARPSEACCLCHAGLRIGLYSPLKSAFGADKDSSALLPKVAAGMLSGALAAGISNPTDLVKTQMQKGGGALGGPVAVMARVVRAEGVRGLWVGTTPSMARAAALTAAQCATYDELKVLFVRNLGWEDNLPTHFTGAATVAVPAWQLGVLRGA
jgi:solute carrier family 25 uncoupling protein 8/9